MMLRYTGEFLDYDPGEYGDRYTIKEAIRRSRNEISLDLMESNGIQLTFTFTSQDGKRFTGYCRRKGGDDNERAEMFAVEYADGEELCLMIRKSNDPYPMGMADLLRAE